MEALAIGLAVYGGVVTFYAVKWNRIAKGWRDVSSGFERAADAWRDRYREARAQIATMDHDGNGKIGGSKRADAVDHDAYGQVSKPRGKG